MPDVDQEQPEPVEVGQSEFWPVPVVVKLEQARPEAKVPVQFCFTHGPHVVEPVLY